MNRDKAARIAPRSDARSRINLVLLGVFLLVVFIFGGASRADTLSQPLVRLASILMLVVVAVQLDRDDWRRIRTPLIFLLAVALVIAVQLVPLPPGLWKALPGRALYVGALESVGLAEGWRPLSLTPDLTLNSLFALLPPIAVVAAAGTIDQRQHSLLVPLMLAGIAVSSLIGLLQVSGGSLYFYEITNSGSAVGVFANRNHQAVFLAAAFPLLACWASLPHADPGYRRLRTWLALCGAAAIFPLLLVTGSRAGLALGGVGVLLALALTLGHRNPARPSGRWPLLLRLAPILIGVAAVGAAIYLSRGEAFDRILIGEQRDGRAEYLPIFIDMAGDFFPSGAGFGAFDPVFRAYEPAATLDFTYLNHAHNDLAQIVIEGGLPALLLLIAFLGWYLARSWVLWRERLDSAAQMLGRTGSAVALILLLSSLVDYPLRTPMLAVMMALGCFWMNRANHRPQRG